jgi:calcium-dependent protein kinase
MRQMDHPNILRLFETFEDAKYIYLILELCTGGELFDKIASEGREMILFINIVVHRWRIV